jgi:hypothetical protein
MAPPIKHIKHNNFVSQRIIFNLLSPKGLEDYNKFAEDTNNIIISEKEIRIPGKPPATAINGKGVLEIIAPATEDEVQCSVLYKIHKHELSERKMYATDPTYQQLGPSELFGTVAAPAEPRKKRPTSKRKKTSK